MGSGDADAFPIANVSSSTFQRCVEFWTHQSEVPTDHDSPRNNGKFVPSQWEIDFHKDDLTHSSLFELILAANFLGCKRLLDVCTHRVAEMIAGKTPEQIRVMFHIKNDFTPEEEEQIERENGYRV